MDVENKTNINEETPITELTGREWKSLFGAGMSWLKANQQIVNALNVFPVPDGDTGTNMLLTMESAWDEIALMENGNAGEIMKAAAQGALMGARGNSGVILSQLWRGFARAMDESETISMELFCKAMMNAKTTAYKGVVRPVEGTILTVLKDTAAAAEEALPNTSNFIELFQAVVKAADVSVDHTPELLPVLKQAGVVDSGGKGLFYIFDGFLRYLTHEPLDISPDAFELSSLPAMDNMNQEETIEPGQDYEVVVDFVPKNELVLSSFYDRLSDMGTSIQVGEGDGMYRMHIHVPKENLYAPINYTMDLGTVTKVAIENLIAQMEEIQRKNESAYTVAEVEPGQIAAVAVSPGDGISKVFASLGAAHIVTGGQTMNPSTEQILKAIENLPTDKVIILPNNKNIILSAQNAASQSKKTVAVINSKNVPQGISAMLRLDPDGDFDTIVSEMNSALTDVESGEITKATRTVELDGVKVNEGQFIAIHNGKLKIAADSLEDALFSFLTEANVEDYERITLFYGSNLEKTEADDLIAKVQEKYPEHEIECHFGGQPHYYFIISIE